MADVRSMLRAERTNRRITHPNASYTTDGKLLCNLCEAVVKSEAAWQSHLHSTGHTLRQSRAQEVAAFRGNGASGKKRKASSLDSPEVETADERKRARPAATAVDQEGGRANAVPNAEVELPVDEVLSRQPTAPTANGEVKSTPSAAEPAAVDEDELAAFERDLAQLESSEAPTTALNANATISAAPMTAEELAAQAREEQSAQRGRRDIEIEAEKEDAVRSLEDEFEEMEGLEERVRRLREKREALRKGSNAASDRAKVGAGISANGEANGHVVIEEVEEDEDDDFDEWAFGGS